MPVDVIAPEAPKLYVIASADGLYLRGGTGAGKWGDKVGEARWYPKLRAARGRVTLLRQLGKSAHILEFVLQSPRVLDESDRVSRSVAAKERREARWAKARQELDLEEAQRALQRAQARLSQLQAK